MTKEELKRIAINNSKIAKLKEKYATLRDKSQTKGQVLTGMPHVSGVKDTIGDYIADLTGIQEEITLLEIETGMLIKRARKFIDLIPDGTIRTILELKYINNLYYAEIVSFLGIREIRYEKDINRLLNTFFLDTLLYM